MKKRCAWVPLNDVLYVEYHDKEWGVPVHEEQLLFEFLTLEIFQAGLSWRTVLYKRKNFRQAFAGFVPEEVARFSEQDINRLSKDSGIIRNKLKINAAIHNARQFLRIQETYGSFDAYIWRFTDGRPIINHWQSIEQLPSETPLSHTISKDLKQHGFKFIGSTIIYAHMQATGMVNDHTIDCHRYRELL